MLMPTSSGEKTRLMKVTNFEGAVVIVSHDEQLLSLACSQLWHCDGEGGVRLRALFF